MVIVDPLPDAATLSPAVEAAEGVISCTDVDVALVFDARLNCAVASAPLAMLVLFSPETMHAYRPGAESEHWMFLPAAIAVVPAETETLLISAGE